MNHASLIARSGNPRFAERTLLRCLITFGLLGPLIGCGAVWTSWALVAGLTGSWDFLGHYVRGLPFVALSVPAAFYFGFVPAVVVGLVYWALSLRSGSFARSLIGVSLIGGVLGVISVSLMSSLPRSVFQFTLLFLPGFIASGVCVLLVGRRMRGDVPGG